MQFTDALELGKPRRTKEGYMAVRARAARTGVYQYAGRQVDPENKHGLRDSATVNVLRDEATVFDKRAVQSFLGKPITVDHPTEPVNAANWKDHSRGAIMGALKDGDYLAFDLLLMDKTAIADVEAGKRQLSNGYAAELEFGDFVAPDGTKCPVRQSQITDGNHVAIVDAGRAGAECRISDGGNSLFQNCDAATVIMNVADEPMEKPVTKITFEGLQVDLSDADAVKALVAKQDGEIAALKDTRGQLETQVATLTTDKQGLEVKVTTLEQALKDAKPTPAQKREAAKAFAKVIADAKRLVPALTITDAMDEPEIRKAVVDAKLAAHAKDYDEASISIAFDTLVAQLGDSSNNVDPIRTPVIADADKHVQDARAEMIADLRGEKKAA